MDDPQDAEDRQAVSEFKGDLDIQIDTARLLGVDKDGTKFLLASRDDQTCLIVITDPEVAAGACDPAENAASDGLALRSGDQNRATFAVIVPDDYTDGRVTSTEPVLLKQGNLVVTRADRNRSAHVAVDGRSKRDLQFGA